MSNESASKTHFDVLIIGGGPSGLTAALTLARQRYTAAVFDSGEYNNAGSSHLHMVPTWDHQDPAEFRAATRKNTLENYQTVTYFDIKVDSVRPNERGTTRTQDCFKLTTSDGTSFYGAKVLLASGVENVFPDIPGPMFGSGAILALHFARSALQFTQKVVIYTDGAKALAREVEGLVGDAGARLSADARRIARIEKLPKGAEVTLHFEDGSSVTEAFLTHMPSVVPRGNLIQSLGIEMVDGDVAIRDRTWQTNVRGVFAAGDIAHHQKIFDNAIWMGCASGAAISVQLQADNLGHQPFGFAE